MLKKVIIAAAGRGARLLPITKFIPKEMLPVIDKPVIQYVLEENIFSSVKEIFLVIDKEKKIILDYIRNNEDKNFQRLLKRVRINVVYQDLENGMYGDAIPVMLCYKFVKNEPFLVSWGDSFGLAQFGRLKRLVETYNLYKTPIASLIKIRRKDTLSTAVPKVRRIKDGLTKISELVLKPKPEDAPSLLGAHGGFILNGKIFNYLDKIGPNKFGEFCLINAIDAYCRENEFLGLTFDGPYFDAGNRSGLAKANANILNFRDNLV